MTAEKLCNYYGWNATDLLMDTETGVYAMAIDWAIQCELRAIKAYEFCNLVQVIRISGELVECNELKVKDLQGEQFQLVQSQDDVQQFNDDYDTDYNYYFIENVDGVYQRLFGSYSITLNMRAWFITNIWS